MFRQRLQIVDQTRRRELLRIELPRRDLFLHAAAEKFSLGHVVNGEQALQLTEFHRADALARLERADGLLADAGEARCILLAHPLEAADFTKFEYEIHVDPHFRDQKRRIRPTTTPCTDTSRAAA